MGSNPPTQPPQPTDLTGAGQVAQGQTADVGTTTTPLVQQGSSPFEAYHAMQSYFGPLSGSAVPAPPQIADPTLQAVADKLNAVATTHPVVSGNTPPSQDSVIARQSANMSAAQIAGAAAKGTWEQAVVQPVQDFIDVWKRDPKAGLMETLGGAALIGGLVGLEALTGGAATPFIFAASAALVAPSIIQSWGDELHNPTDSNLVKALVSTGTGLLTVGVPVKWAQGMQLGRNSLAFALKAKRDWTAPEEVMSAVLTGHPEWRKWIGQTGRPIQEELATLGDRADVIKAQYEQFGISLKDKNASALLKRTEAMDGLRNAYVASTDPVKREELKAKMLSYAKEEVLPLRLKVAQHYMFLPQSKMSHIPLNPIEGIEKGVALRANSEGQAIMGYIRSLGRGHPGLHDVQLSGASLIEHSGRDMAAGGSGFLISKINYHHDELLRHLGIDDGALTKIEHGLEDPEAWAKLTPKQQFYGQMRYMMEGARTQNELRWGTIPNAVAGYLPRLFSGAEDVPHTAGVRDVFASLRGGMFSRSRIWKAAFDSMSGDINYTERSRAEIMAEEERLAGIYKAQQPLRDFLASNMAEVTKARETASGYLRWIERYKNQGNMTKAAQTHAKLQLHYTEQSLKGAKHAELVHMPADAFERLKKIAPLQRRLMTGSDLFKASFGSYVYRMEEASLRAAAETHANAAIGDLQKLFLKTPLGKYGITMQTPEFLSKNPLPDFMPESAFAKGVGASRGYKEVFRAIGRPGDLHYRPAIYAKDALADEMHKIMDGATTGSEVFSGFSGAVYKTLHGSKRLIMATPFWHAMNVTGRLVAFALEDPVGAKTALSTVWGKGEFLLNPEERAALETEASQNGLLHANKFEVTNQQHRALKNQDAQSTWPTVLRTLTGPMSHAYQDMLEGGFWKMVDDFQLAAYQLGKHRLSLKLPNEPPAEVGRLAAEYANNLAGMVNPLYMNKVYRHARNLMWFAPSYWATFVRTLVSMPGSDRLSNFLAAYRGGEFVRFGAVPLKAVSQAGRRELVRMQRSWVMTYLATGIVAADMMNVMLGGRHIWENDPGHMFDINVDNFASWSHKLPGVGGLSPGGPETLPSGEVRHTYIAAIPFFRQAADVMNALGMGHDWGLGHEFSDQTWQQAGALQKAQMMGGALLDGVRRESSNKLGGIPMAAYGAITGEELSARLGQGVQRQVKGPIGNMTALLNLVPGGLQLQRFFSQQEQLAAKYPVGSPQYLAAQQQAAQGAAQAIPSALIQQFTGMPSMYHIGPEQAPVDDKTMTNWYQQRNQLYDGLQNASKEVFMGQMTPLDYERKRQQMMDRLIQLDADTFGASSPAAPLAKVRADLAQTYGLDNLGLSNAQWYTRYTQYQSAWDQILQSASPQSRAVWWQAEHSQWTDADYLAWEAKELKKSIASSIDGQGGQHIQAYENQISGLQALPLTTAERLQLEEGDPYYYTYRQVIKAMSRNTALGAFINAFTSPFSETYIMPSGLSADAQAQIHSMAPATSFIVTPEEAQRLAAQAKLLASSPEVTAAGGEAQNTPGFQATTQQLEGQSGV